MVRANVMPVPTPPAIVIAIPMPIAINAVRRRGRGAVVGCGVLLVTATSVGGGRRILPPFPRRIHVDGGQSVTDDPPRLFAVYLGGRPAPGRMGEDHEVVFVVATGDRSARNKARAKWKGHGSKPHVDAVVEINAVDGYVVHLDAA